MRLLFVALGGAAGATARYLVAGWASTLFGAGFPWGTLLVNALGSFGLAFLMQVGLSTDLVSPNTRLVIGTGFFGALTTYSTFNLEATVYLQERAFGLAAAYFAGTVLLCLLFAFLGFFVARQVFGS